MRVYYNEWDHKAAAWLRQLIEWKLIPDGDVDERSILDVEEVDLWGYDQHHFFAGIAGWPLALQMAGLDQMAGVMTGSPPCQPFSSAGQRKGKDDERHLAPKFIELVRAVRPKLLFGEQVASAAVFGKAAGSARDRAKRATREPDWCWFDDLSDRLEAARYAVGASDIPAAGIGAPHLRQRTFFGAVDLEWLDHASSTRSSTEGEGPEGEAWNETRLCGPECGRSVVGMGDTSGSTGERDSREVSGTETTQHGTRVTVDGGVPVGPEHADSGMGGMADAKRSKRRSVMLFGHKQVDGSKTGGKTAESSRDRHGNGMANTQHDEQRSRGRSGCETKARPQSGSEPGRCGETGGMADSLEPGLEGHTGDGDGSGQSGRIEADQAGPTASGSRTGRRADTDHGGWTDVDWLFCRDGKWRPAQSSVLRMADGLPDGVVPCGSVCGAWSPLTTEKEGRVMRLKGYGNAIVPQCGEVFIGGFMDSLWWIK